jgi:DedD protein
VRNRGQSEDDKDSELTLRPATLLGIFLGLVLICGVFFGFGYSVGRRATSGGSIDASVDSDAQETDTPAPATAKPSAARAVDTDDAGSASSAASDTLLKTSDSAPAVLPVSGPPARADAPATAAATVTPVAAGNANHPAPPQGADTALKQPAGEGQPEAGQTVVQVAAVTRQEDADALVSALRQRGYRVMERNEPQDKLLHVQVGPFSSREDANAMKQKLLADGYNAIIKN